MRHFRAKSQHLDTLQLTEKEGWACPKTAAAVGVVCLACPALDVFLPLLGQWLGPSDI